GYLQVLQGAAVQQRDIGYHVNLGCILRRNGMPQRAVALLKHPPFVLTFVWGWRLGGPATAESYANNAPIELRWLYRQTRRFHFHSAEQLAVRKVYPAGRIN